MLHLLQILPTKKAAFEFSAQQGPINTARQLLKARLYATTVQRLPQHHQFSPLQQSLQTALPTQTFPKPSTPTVNTYHASLTHTLTMTFVNLVSGRTGVIVNDQTVTIDAPAEPSQYKTLLKAAKPDQDLGSLDLGS